MLIVCLSSGFVKRAEKRSPSLRVSCSADKRSYAANDAVDLTIALDNLAHLTSTSTETWNGFGPELGSAFRCEGNVVQVKQRSIPLPPHLYDKTKLVSLARGRFLRTHLAFDLSHYALEPVVYSIEVSYRST